MYDVNSTNWIAGTRYFTQVTNNDHSAWLYIVTLLSLCYIIIVFAVRFVVKYGMYGRDDWALLASTILAVGQHFASLAGLGKGMGKSASLLSSAQRASAQRYTSAHAFLFALAHCASKLSSALLTQRLFENGRRRNFYMCWCLVGASVCFGLWEILSLSIDCPESAFPLRATDACPHRYLRWQLNTAVDIATELMLVAVPCILLTDVQVKPKDKALAMAVFAVRLPDVIFAALTLHSLPRNPEVVDIGLALAYPFIWTQTELLWSIVAASVPCLRSFMRPFDQVDEDTWRSNNDMYASQRSGGRTWPDPRDGDGAVPLKDMKVHKRGIFTADDSDGVVSVRPDKVGHNVTIAHTTADDAFEDAHERSPSWGSQERIIRAQTHWEVRHESGHGVGMAFG